ncbi:putative signal transduction protein with CBS domains [Methanocaldococcus infernus ME]|uniref:Signal transduction protein with CBS domains n=1 Tax=Methanocaldococcus infernus (strain DSM 11812 / JCM 15783 / ME) TaxID=573063 RepID=D5VTU9_METIM|nr:CBS domain-containing protein [Methanocaldococcus infernus]ADG14002.1 putative signal transduction protein with CBS domains [Methanocaldococcus infernus ME]
MVADVPVVMIMKEPIIVGGNISVYDVAKLMVKENVPCVLVVYEKNRDKIGVAKDEDIVKKVIFKKIPLDKVKVEEIVSEDILKVPPDKTITEVLNLMKKTGKKEVFIVDEGKIIGMITIDEIINISPELLDTLKSLVDYLLKIIDEVLEEDKKIG